MAAGAAELVLRIDAAFGGEAYPGDDRIVPPGAGDPEAERVASTLRGWHWRDLPYDLVERLRLSLPFLTAEAYRFYLPAFMAMTVVDFERAAAVADEVVRSLTLPVESDVERTRAAAEAHPEAQPFDAAEWTALLDVMSAAYRPGGAAAAMFAERVSGFTADQRDVIREFLEFLRDAYGDEFPDREPDRALERYWAEPATGLGGPGAAQ